MSSYNTMPFDTERVRVHRFTEARAMARDCASRPKPDGTNGSIIVSMAGGKKRWAVFTETGGFIGVHLMNTEIMRFYPLGIVFRMQAPGAPVGEFNSVTTRSVVNNLLPAGAVTGTADGEKMFYQAPGSPDPVEVSSQELTVRYSGQVAPEGISLTPKPRSAVKPKTSTRPGKSRKTKESKEKETVAA